MTFLPSIVLPKIMRTYITGAVLSFAQELSRYSLGRACEVGIKKLLYDLFFSFSISFINYISVFRFVH